MAMLGLNALTIWDDYAPINLREVVSFCHEYGIQVTFGYSWGWDEGVDALSDQELERWQTLAITKYEHDYLHAKGDGIYFQAFTETTNETIHGTPIAEAVVKWTNSIAGAMLSKWPDLKIQFGLHATSVINKIDVLSRVDPRVNIVWEDVGSFPFAYMSRDTHDLEQTRQLTDRIRHLRPTTDPSDTVGVVLKGQVCLDWSNFEHQKGPYLLGVRSEKQIAKRREKVRTQWHDVQSYWLKNLSLYRYTLRQLDGASIYDLVEDASLETDCWFSVALYALSLWDSHTSDLDLIQLVAQRSNVVFA